jgi:endonuclease/exonuclease/phosphatase family metal-dependent hydrolase
LRVPGALATVLVLAALVWRYLPGTQRADSLRSGESLLVCIWNVENLFDDQDDLALEDEIEDWMAREPRWVEEKARRVAEALRLLGGGRGPDLIGLMEVENRRALELARAALNEGRSGGERYEWLVHRDLRTGRRIEPAWLARVPIRPGSPGARRRGGSRRIVEAVLELDPQQPIHLLLSHWTSRRQARSGEQRAGYARELRLRLDELRSRDPNVAVVLAGDFNEEAGTPVLRLLTDGAGLIDLLASVEPHRQPTLVYQGRGYGYDHVWATRSAVAGLGWRVEPGSADVVDGPPLREPKRTDRRPWRFGGPGHVGARGYSDHFPVIFRLVKTGAVAVGRR